MRIAVVAPFEETVPPIKYGGTELVVSNLTEGLQAKGHDVTLFACGDAKTKATLIPIFPKSLRTIPKMADMKIRETYKYLGLSRVLDHLKNSTFDIVHNHIGWRFLLFQNLITIPSVTTLHGPLDINYQKEVYINFKKSNYVSISNSQRHPLPKLNYTATVYNGIDETKFTFNHQRAEKYFAFLGRMSPEKGPIEAIKAAKEAKVKLIMAAKVDAVDQDYFTQQIKPLIDQKQICFIGEVDHAGKVDLLSKARALLAPIQWEEPFGLFFIEAMACGIPVITFNRGSVPEIIQDGLTGFIAKKGDMPALIDGIRTFNNMNEDNYQKIKQNCRKRIEKDFTVEKMVSRYEKVYQELTDKI